MSNLGTIAMDCPDCGVHLDVPMLASEAGVADGVATFEVSFDSAHLAEHSANCHA